MTPLPENNEYGLKKATKVESVLLSERGRRYGTLALAALGVLEVVNPSNNVFWSTIKSVLGMFGYTL
jgi:hypothetical protein